MALELALIQACPAAPSTEDVGARHPHFGRAADPAPPRYAGAALAHDVVRHFGQEVAMALNSASDQLERLSQLEPSLVGSLPVGRKPSSAPARPAWRRSTCCA